VRLACGFDHAGEALRETVLGCNVLCLGARVVGSAVAAELVVAFAEAAFSGEERHTRRLARVQALEDRGWGSGA